MQQVIIHIGFPRAGSTYLQNYFSLHPDVFYDGKLPGNYRLTGVVPDIIIPQNTNATHIVISEEQFSVWNGNVDVVGVRFKLFDVAAHQQMTLKRLQELFPQSRILIITRGFKETVISMYAQYIKVGGVLKFSAFQKEYAVALGEFYNYDRLIEYAQQIFGEQKVLVLPFELLQESPGKFLREIETEFDLQPQLMTNEKMNASLNEGEVVSYRKISSVVFSAISWLPYGWQKTIYGSYVWLLYQGRLNGLQKVFSEKAEEKKDVAEETLLSFKGKAERLLRLPQFSPYRKAYQI